MGDYARKADIARAVTDRKDTGIQLLPGKRGEPSPNPTPDHQQKQEPEHSLVFNPANQQHQQRHHHEGNTFQKAHLQREWQHSRHFADAPRHEELWNKPAGIHNSRDQTNEERRIGQRGSENRHYGIDRPKTIRKEEKAQIKRVYDHIMLEINRNFFRHLVFGLDGKKVIEQTPDDFRAAIVADRGWLKGKEDISISYGRVAIMNARY